MRSMFGGNSNLPPGCTVGDIERAFGGGDPFPEEEEALLLLEDAGVPTEVNDKIAEIIGKLCENVATLSGALEEIERIPLHPCDDARNAAGLERARRIARGQWPEEPTEEAAP